MVESLVDIPKTPSAAALVIGNELLTGKIREANVEVLAKELFGLGIRLARVVFCPDEVAAIVAELDPLRAGHDWVFTSGGGPHPRRRHLGSGGRRLRRAARKIGD